MRPVSDKKDIRLAGLVSSSQAGVHPQLEKHVRRHLATRWSQPLHRPTVGVYRQLEANNVFAASRPIILDSGCGTGKSTQKLAELNPDCLVVGVDRSLVRLGRHVLGSGICQCDNWVLARGELTTFWRLLYEAGHVLERHLLLYPNPWPKPGHLQRRWHAHPVLPWLLGLGGEIELRCNWEIYALEFAAAMQIATGNEVSAQRYRPEEGFSPFETKYMERGHALYSVFAPKAVTATFKFPWQKEHRSVLQIEL